MRELLVRTLSGVVYVGVLLGAMALGTPVWLGLWILLGIWCLWEYLRMNMISLWKVIIAFLITGSFGLYVWFSFDEFLMLFLLFNPFYTIGIVLGISSWFWPEIFPKEKGVVLGIVFIICAFLSGFVFAHITSSNPMSPLRIFLPLWIFDTFAYLGGRFLKGPKIAPQISPSKTWSGTLVGALCTVVVIAFVIPEIWPALVLGIKIHLWAYALICSFTALLGDLLESKWKRRAGAKDSSTLIPGHGGLLDRLDSALLTAILWPLWLG